MVVPIMLAMITRRSGVRASLIFPLPKSGGAAAPGAGQLELGVGAAVGGGQPRGPAVVAGAARIDHVGPPDTDAELPVADEGAGRARRARLVEMEEQVLDLGDRVAALYREQPVAVAREIAARRVRYARPPKVRAGQRLRPGADLGIRRLRLLFGPGQALELIGVDLRARAAVAPAAGGECE